MTSSSAPSSPALLNSKFGCVLVLGRSGSGKTTFVKKVLARLKPAKLFIVNGDAYDYKGSGRKTWGGFTPNDYPKHESNSVFVIEDIIHVRGSAEVNLRESLNYYARHKNQKYFFVSHSIHKTSLYSTLNFFHFIVFPLHPTSKFIIKQILDSFRLEKKDVEEMLSKVRMILLNYKGGQPGTETSCFFFNVQTANLIFATNIFKAETFINLENSSALGLTSQTSSKPDLLSNQQQQQQQRQALCDRFEELTNQWQNRAEAKSVFSIVAYCVNPQLIRYNDLAFCFESRSKSQIFVSLVDYVSVLLSKNAVPSVELKVLHTFISSKCKLPVHFIVNKSLLVK